MQFGFRQATPLRIVSDTLDTDTPPKRLINLGLGQGAPNYFTQLPGYAVGLSPCVAVDGSWLVQPTQPLQPPSHDVANIWQMSFAAPLISHVADSAAPLCDAAGTCSRPVPGVKPPPAVGDEVGRASIMAACVACGGDIDTRPKRHLSAVAR